MLTTAAAGRQWDMGVLRRGVSLTKGVIFKPLDENAVNVTRATRGNLSRYSVGETDIELVSDAVSEALDLDMSVLMGYVCFTTCCLSQFYTLFYSVCLTRYDTVALFLQKKLRAERFAKRQLDIDCRRRASFFAIFYQHRQCLLYEHRVCCHCTHCG